MPTIPTHPFRTLLAWDRHPWAALGLRLGAVLLAFRPWQLFIQRVVVLPGDLDPQVVEAVRANGVDPFSPAGWPTIPGTLLRTGEVEALVADLGDCVAWTPVGALPVEGRLAHWEERLEGQGYVRIHRNALVRLDAVREFTDTGEVVLSATRLQVSVRRLDEVRGHLGL